MKKFIFLTALALLSASPAFALLSPLNQSVNEIKAIMDTPQAIQSLPQGESIQAIYKMQNGYMIMTQTMQMLVEIKYAPSNGPGPKKFDVIPHKPTKPTTSNLMQ